MNHSHVTRAREHVEAVAAARTALLDIHAKADGKPYSDRLGRVVAGHYDAIRIGTKLAEAHAQIAQAEALERIANAMEARA